MLAVKMFVTPLHWYTDTFFSPIFPRFGLANSCPLTKLLTWQQQTKEGDNTVCKRKLLMEHYSNTVTKKQLYFNLQMPLVGKCWLVARRFWVRTCRLTKDLNVLNLYVVSVGFLWVISFFSHSPKTCRLATLIWLL